MSRRKEYMQWRVVIFVLLLLQFYPVEAQQDDVIFPIVLGVKQVHQVTGEGSHLIFEFNIDQAAVVHLEVESLDIQRVLNIAWLATNSTDSRYILSTYGNNLRESNYLLPEYTYKIRISIWWSDPPLDFSILITQQSAPAFEDNNSAEKAHRLMFDTPHSSLLNTTENLYELDWYTFDLYQPSTIRISLSDFGSRDDRPFLELWKQNTMIGQADYYGVNRSRQLISQLQEGKYYVVINSTSIIYGINIPILYTISITKNYDLSPASQSIYFDQGFQQFLGSVNQTNSDEWLFEVKDEMTIAMYSASYPWDENFTVNFDPQPVFYEEYDSSAYGKYWYHLEEGSYNISIETSRSSLTDYLLEIFCVMPDEFETNSSLQGSITMEESQFIETNLHGPGDEDVYVFELDNPGNLTLQFENWENLEVTVRELHGNTLEITNATIDENGLITISAKQTYYEVLVEMLRPAPYVFYVISYEFIPDSDQNDKSTRFKISMHFQAILTTSVTLSLLERKIRRKYE